MTQYFRQNTIEEQGRNYGSKNLIKYQIALLNFSELNVLIFKTRKIFSILLMSHCWRKLWSKKMLNVVFEFGVNSQALGTAQIQAISSHCSLHSDKRNCKRKDASGRVNQSPSVSPKCIFVFPHHPSRSCSLSLSGWSQDPGFTWRTVPGESIKGVLLFFQGMPGF